jgi:phosphopantothenoylcysteine decarboxylase/phosphopantothenate--cysteine ligase
MFSTTLKNKQVLITAGPTKEAIDPVRFISNHSTGKMGYAIAEYCLQAGAFVTLVSGPVCLQLRHPQLTVVKVSSANEMWQACQQHFDIIDMAIFAAAVADYRPEMVAAQKIKKQADTFIIKMVKNVDIACEFGKVKKVSQVAVGFALETENELVHATIKLKKKNFDMVVLNSVNDANATFGFDTNKITIVKNDGSITPYALKNKSLVAEDIVTQAGICLAAKTEQVMNETVSEYEMMYW